jgi:hypothetical protein
VIEEHVFWLEISVGNVLAVHVLPIV